MSRNDVVGLAAQYNRWLKRTTGLKLPNGATPFDLFCAEQFLKPHVLLTDNDILDGLIGRSKDGGVDCFYFLLNGLPVEENTEIGAHQEQSVHIVIIQTKETSGFSANSIDKFNTFSEDLFDLGKKSDKYGREYHEGLKDKMRIFKEKFAELSLPKTTVDYYYVTKLDAMVDQGSNTAGQKVIDTAKHQMRAAKVNDFHFINAAHLYTQVTSRPPKMKTLTFTEKIDAPEGYIGLVTLSEFNSFLKNKFGERNDLMFDDNVRGFQRETAVNESIQRTLSDATSPEFWLLNNGVTILSSKVQPKPGKSIEITDPQIVNGLQTSRQIFSYHASQGAPPNDQRRILVRVITNDNEDVRDKVIRATNNQNPMPAEALFTTFRIHKQIEQVFLNYSLYYERRKGFYRDQDMPIAQIVMPKELIPAVIAIMTDNPHDARSHPTRYIAEEDKRWSIFGHDDYDDSNITSDPKVANNPPFDIGVYLSCVLLVRRVNKFLNKKKKLDPASRRNTRFYLAKYAACAAIKNAYCPPAEIAKIKADEISDQSLETYFRKVLRIYRRNGGNDAAGKSQKMSSDLKKHLQKTF